MAQVFTRHLIQEVKVYKSKMTHSLTKESGAMPTLSHHSQTLSVNTVSEQTGTETGMADSNVGARSLTVQASSKDPVRLPR